MSSCLVFVMLVRMIRNNPGMQCPGLQAPMVIYTFSSVEQQALCQVTGNKTN